MSDPFNWPFPQRGDLMSLNAISREKDQVRVKTAAISFRPRGTSMNLATEDIRGKS